MEFDKYSNIDIKRFEIASIVRILYKKLPVGVSYPSIIINKPKGNENGQSFLSYSFTAPMTTSEISLIVKQYIQPEINSIKGIYSTTITGSNSKEVVIKYNHTHLEQIGISKKEIIIAIQNYFNKEILGTTFKNGEFLILTVQPKFNEVNWKIPIKNIEGRIIYLSDIATIKEKEKEIKEYYRVNGINSINLSISSANDVNTITLTEKIDKRLKTIKPNLPDGFKIVQNYNSSDYLKKELNIVYIRSIVTMLILLIFIFIISFSWKYLLIIILSLVANLGIAFLFYWLLGVELNLFSIAGITISFGLIIDNIIVMIDHIKKQGNTKVFIPILASSLTSMGALSAIYFIDESQRLNLSDFALVIIINLGVSLLVAFFLIPSLLNKIPLKKIRKNKYPFSKILSVFYVNIITKLIKWKRVSLVLIILLFGIPLFMIPQEIDKNNTWYQKLFNTTLGNEWYVENVRPQIDIYLGGTFRLFSTHVFNKEYYKNNNETKLYLVASMEKGANIHQMNSVFLNIENYLNQFKEIKNYRTNIVTAQNGQIEISFKNDFENSTFPNILKSKLILKALSFGGISLRIYGVGNAFINGEGGNLATSNFEVIGKGFNYDDLNIWSNTLKQKLLKNSRIQKVEIVENSNSVDRASYEYVIDINKEKLTSQNLTQQKIYDEMAEITLSNNFDISLWKNGKYTPIRFESTESNIFDIWHLKNTSLGPKNQPFNLMSIVSTSKQKEDDNIFKENQEYTRKIEFQYYGQNKFGLNYLNETLKELANELPMGYTFELPKHRPYFGKSTSDNFYLLILIVGIIYLICAILFESLKQPFIILSLIPISFIGVFLIFYLFDYNFDQGGMASFVLLSGITVNSSILILNEYNRLERKFININSITLYVLAFKQKITPVLLTIASTIIGFIPFIMLGQTQVFWFALGLGTIGGLVFSLIGIFIYLPIFTIKKY